MVPLVSLNLGSPYYSNGMDIVDNLASNRMQKEIVYKLKKRAKNRLRTHTHTHMQPTERKKKRKHRLDLCVCVFGGSFLITIIVSSRLAFIPNGCQMLLSHCKKKKIPCCSYHRQTTNLLFFIIQCFFCCCPGVSLCPLSFVLCLSG